MINEFKTQQQQHSFSEKKAEARERNLNLLQFTHKLKLNFGAEVDSNFFEISKRETKNKK